MSDSEGPAARGASNFRRTLVQVVVIQLVALAFLAFLQLNYNA